MKKYNIILFIISILVIFFNCMYFVGKNIASGIQIFKNYVEIELINFNNNEYFVEGYNDDKLISEKLYYKQYSDKDTIKCILLSDDTFKEKDELKIVVSIKKNDGVIIERKIVLKQHTENEFAYEFDCDTGKLEKKEVNNLRAPKYPIEQIRFILKMFVIILDIIFAIYLIIYFKKLVKYIKENDKKENIKK